MAENTTALQAEIKALKEENALLTKRVDAMEKAYNDVKINQTKLAKDIKADTPKEEKKVPKTPTKTFTIDGDKVKFRFPTFSLEGTTYVAQDLTEDEVKEIYKKAPTVFVNTKK